MFISFSSYGQTKITGIVVDNNDIPLIGANLSLTTNLGAGTITDFDGKFELEVDDLQQSIIISYTGYQTKTIALEGKTEWRIVLEEGVELNEIVVTALGISRNKKALTYSAQNFDTDEMTQARSLNITESLSGKIAGIAVTSSGEGVGGATKVLLRGNRSISGSSQPLYVVDGIILNGDIRNLSPDDIEEMTVLKGANAAALYGSRANNGAIIITTKSGKGGDNGVTSSVNVSFQANDPLLLTKYQNEYGQGSAGIYAPAALTSWGPKLDGSQVEHWSNDPSYIANQLGGSNTYSFSAQPDNVSDMLRTGYSLSTNLSTSINQDKSSTFLSYTYTDAKGVIEGNDLGSHNLNARISADLFEGVEVDAKVNYIRQNFANVLSQGENYDNPYRYLYILPRNIRTEDIAYYQFTNDIGENTQHYWSPGINGGGNPYWVMNNVTQPSLRERVIGMVSLKYQITDNLSILGRSSLDRNNDFSEFLRYNDTYTRANNGSYSKTFNNGYDWNSDFLINYKVDLDLPITIDISAGGNLRKNKFDQILGSGANFNIANLFSLANTLDPRPTESFYEKEVQSVYAFGQFGFFNGIYLDITARNDWSSTLPADNRSYFYPSFGLTAVLSDLMNLPSYFTFLKLRGSWAAVGNDTDPYQIARAAIVRRGTVLLDPTLPATNLKPERTNSFELGLDARFLDNALRLDLTYYNSSTYDQLFETPIPPASGAGSVFQNGADVLNKGIEFTLGATPVTTNDFSWDVNFNFAKNTSEILEIAEGFDVLNLGSDFIRSYQLKVGEPFGNVVTRGFLRDDAGRVIVNSSGLPEITPGLDVVVANYNPDWLGGFSNSFTYKDFNFSFLIDIRQGGTIVSFSEAIQAGFGVLDYTVPGRDGDLVFGENVFADEVAVNADGSPNTIQISSEDLWNNLGGRNTPVGEAFVRDASNIRMREMILGYTFPSKKVRVSLVGRNLFFITNKAENVDPEIVAGTGNSSEGREAFAPPTNRTFGFSVNIQL
ncbi:SusC/RagA family TonB-linked outer membrane protein [Membranihabitans marinus]|uniref:SusC/RagA family TonB-linked outer membrane protein n=1 Tax=Membranihabitans marinus TaxID=1227546 RepID=UPI001EFFC45C|nr:SusC/RagA family TonB-linked outer membrane protein [Membranihabitans marinus]